MVEIPIKHIYQDDGNNGSKCYPITHSEAVFTGGVKH